MTTARAIYHSTFTQLLLITAVALALGYVIAVTGINGAAGLLALPFGVAYIALLSKNPRIGLYTTMHIGFVSNGIGRYSDAPLGLSIDIVLLLTLIVTFSKLQKRNYRYLKNPFVWGIAVWTVFTILEVVNPESRSMAAWFYAVRGTSFYMIQLIILTILLLNDRKNLDTFLRIWIGWSVLAALWALKQTYIGLNSAEQAWMAAGAYKTHMLFGKLRAFSFYSDAGQFGAAMGHILLVCIILAIGPFSLKRRLMLWALCILFFWAMAISGTRGAMFVPLSGILVYLVLSKNFKILSIGVIVLSLLFCLLKFTNVGSGNYQVQRMRSGLNPNDPSLQVRLNNQAKLKVYLASRPLGGGIGASGYWGLRFSPNSFLAQTPTDSWYVKIWADTGIVGLYLHIAMILVFVVTGGFLIFKMKNDPGLRQINAALFAGFVGIAFASYGNSVIGQTPTSVVVFMSIGFIWLIYRWDKGIKIKKTEEENLIEESIEN